MRMLRKFLRDEKGAVAVEMAFVGPPFILLLLTIIEMGLTLLTQSVLDGATRDAARMVRTGQIAAAGTVTQQVTLFQTTLCGNLSALLIQASCDSNVIFDVEPFATFGGVSFTHTPPCTQNFNSTGSGVACPFNVGTGGQIIGVQVQYSRPFIIPWVGGCLSHGSCWAGLGTSQGSNPGTGKVLQSSVVVFRNEPQ